MTKFINTKELACSQSAIAAGEKNDCVVRAFAVAFGVDYNTAHTFVGNEMGRREREGTYNAQIVYVMKRLADSLAGYNSLRPVEIEPNTYYKNQGHTVCRRMTIHTLLKHPGTHFILVRGHAFAIRDGVVLGDWLDAKRLRVRIMNVWKIEVAS